MSDELLKLAERCEQASGPDRELDLVVYLSLNPEGDVAKIMARGTNGLDGCSRFAWELRGGALLFEQRNDRGDCTYNGGIPVPAYTASLDAAMMLTNRYGVLLHLSDIGADGLPLCNIGDSVTAREFKGVGTANLALAVCAAALRARAAETTS